LRIRWRTLRRLRVVFILVVAVLALIRLNRFVIVNYIPNDLLQRLKPHPEKSSHFSEALYIAREIVVLIVTDIFDQVLCKAIAIPAEGIVVTTVPEVTHISDDFINFFKVVVSNTDWYLLF